MKSALSYRNEEANNGIEFVKENARQYVELLDVKIDKYIEQLKNIEVKCSRPRVNREHLLAEVTVLNDSMLEACAQFERQVQDPETIKTAQTYFRARTNPILSKSYLINRCRTWPRGQQGDFETLELAYKNIPLSEGLGYYLDKYLVGTDLGIGVRERIEKLRDLLKEELKNRPAPKVLDVACGSCREVFELMQEINSSKARYTCVDIDPEALNFARDRFSHAGLLSDQVELLTYNALRMFDYETAVTDFGEQDIIYSVGYFDYLPDDFLEKMLKTLYMLLKPGGKLITSFKDANRYRPHIYHWLVDWDGFLQRTEIDFDRLLRRAAIPDSALEMTRLESGSIIFYVATKNE
jgi:SAM-dependent methyltransferase